MDSIARSRPAIESDFEFAWQLYSSAVRPLMEQYIARVRSSGWDDAVEKSLFRSVFDARKSLILEVDATAIGWASVDDSQNTVVLENIYIDEMYRNKGIGTTFINWLIAFYRGRPFLVSIIASSRSNTLYRRLGFTEEKTLGFETIFARS